MRPFLHHAIRQIDPESHAYEETFPFNLQNGKEILDQYFGDVQRHDYEDSLSITETQDLIDWIKSSIAIANFSESNLNSLYHYFESIRKKEGAIHIPKETGLFISTHA